MRGKGKRLMRGFYEWGYFNLENLELLELLENRTTHTDPSSLCLCARKQTSYDSDVRQVSAEV